MNRPNDRNSSMAEWPDDATVHLDDLRCADVVLGLLSEGERAQALAHVAGCPVCESRLRAHAAADARAAFDRPGRETTRVTALPVAWYRRPVAGLVLAAAATLIAVGALPLLRGGARAPEPARELPAPGERVRTREGLPEDPHLAAGLDAFAKHDFATADRELSQAKGSGTGEQMRRLYLADVRLARGDAHGAVALLRSLRWLDVPEPWRRDAAGLLVRALRKAGEGAEADSIERALRSLEPGTPFVP